MNHGLWASIAAAFSVGTVISTVAVAQENAVLEEIIVTAQKRSQSIQDVGISITALSGDDLRRQSAFSSTDIAMQTPGLSIGTPVGEGNNPSIVLRGVGLNDFGDNNEAPVGVYIDGIYYGSLAGQTFQLFDLERVEVLRGPQGTLYGRNTTGGLVHFITKRPGNIPEGYVDAMYGSYNSVRLEGAVGGPVAGNVSARLAGVVDRHDGYMKNFNPLNSTNPSNGDSYAARLQLQYASEATHVLLNLHGARNDSRAAGFKHGSSFNGADGLAEPLPRNVDFYGTCPGCDAFGYVDATGERFAGEYDEIGRIKIDTYGGSLTLDHEFGDVTFTSISGAERLDKEYVEDTDMTPLPLEVLTTTAHNSQVSQEFRLDGVAGALRWQAGAYYFSLDADLKNGLDLSGLGFVNMQVNARQETDSWAAFGQFEYAFTDVVKFIGGARYTDETKDYSYVSRDAAGIIPGNAFEFTRATVGKLAEQSDGSIDFRAELDFTLQEDLMLYASISRGHKGAGFNLGFFDASGIFGSDVPGIIPFNGEELTSYEVGLKSKIGERTLLNASGYYYDYSDYQALSFRQLSQVIGNADAEVYGAEIELVTHPTEALQLSAAASVLNATAHDIPDPLTLRPRDRDMVLAPSVTLNGSAQYEWPLMSGRMTFRVDGAYKGSHYFDIQNHPATRESGYFVGNAGLSYRLPNDHVEFTAFVKNFTGEDYRTYVFNLTDANGALQQALGRPRWFGVSMRLSF